MSKRVTLTDYEIEQIVIALTRESKEGIDYHQVVKIGRHFYDQLIAKLKGQHPRSVETLGVSGNGDDKSIPRKKAA
ncbi:MAG TPA: hypothetical protein VFT87_01125 [Candidatus Saccharimonadales bacterium]|nr:hypothetical protein [Candidatus Saccharimonadales bacterium]